MLPARMCSQSFVRESPRITLDASQLLVDHVASHDEALALYRFTPPPIVAISRWSPSNSNCDIELLVR